MRFDVRTKEGAFPLVLALLALAAASYRFVFVPEIAEIRALKAEVARKEAEVADIMALRTAVEESRRGDGQQLDQRLRSWEQRVPASPQPELLLAEIGERAVRHRLASFGLTAAAEAAETARPAESPESGANPKAVRSLRETRYRLTFRSTYRDLAEFLDGIPSMRRLVTVRSVAIRGEGGAMTATVDVSAWHRGTP
ncbi:MAG: hypothetical protein AB1346_11590 [Thermodesulfobacteriota bacterium]